MEKRLKFSKFRKFLIRIIFCLQTEPKEGGESDFFWKNFEKPKNLLSPQSNWSMFGCLWSSIDLYHLHSNNDIWVNKFCVVLEVTRQRQQTFDSMICCLFNSPQTELKMRFVHLCVASSMSNSIETPISICRLTNFVKWWEIIIKKKHLRQYQNCHPSISIVSFSIIKHFTL